MANLNSRDYVRGRRDQESSLELSGVQFAVKRNDVCLLASSLLPSESF